MSWTLDRFLDLLGEIADDGDAVTASQLSRRMGLSKTGSRYWIDRARAAGEGDLLDAVVRSREPRLTKEALLDLFRQHDGGPQLTHRDIGDQFDVGRNRVSAALAERLKTGSRVITVGVTLLPAVGDVQFERIATLTGSNEETGADSIGYVFRVTRE